MNPQIHHRKLTAKNTKNTKKKTDADWLSSLLVLLVFLVVKSA